MFKSTLLNIIAKFKAPDETATWLYYVMSLFNRKLLIIGSALSRTSLNMDFKDYQPSWHFDLCSPYQVILGFYFDAGFGLAKLLDEFDKF